MSSLMFSGWEQRLGQAGTLFAVMEAAVVGCGPSPGTGFTRQR